MQACAPALMTQHSEMQCTHFPTTPRCGTRAEWCYCINTSKVKTQVMRCGTRDKHERSGKHTCWMQNLFPVGSRTTKQHLSWMRNNSDLSGSNAQGEYIFSERETKWKTKEKKEGWSDYMTKLHSIESALWWKTKSEANVQCTSNKNHFNKYF